MASATGCPSRTQTLPTERAKRSSHERRTARREADPHGYVTRLLVQAAEHRARADAVQADPHAYAERQRQRAVNLVERADRFAAEQGMTLTAYAGQR
ncbi:hypothetical protein ACWFNE_15025 [Cellulomonas sp. NPDC055163]